MKKVVQGFISPRLKPASFYEGVLVYFNPELIKLEKLIEIHLQTHKSTSNHRMRFKYLSAIYTFSDNQNTHAKFFLAQLQNNYKEKIITKAYSFHSFKASRKEIRNYYKTDPQRPFCKVYIEPKLELLKQEYSLSLIDSSKLYDINAL